MSTMIHLSDAQSSHIMTEDEIRTVCPVAFKTAPTNPDVSDKYVQATTIDVVRDMEKLGWHPVEAKQCRARKGSKGIRSFHMIAFENENVKIVKGDSTEAMVRVILTNSHDGFNSFKFMCGIYRLICSNGLVVSDMEFESISIRHINYDFNELRYTIAAMLDKIPEVVAKMNQMTAVTLTEEQKINFAKEAYRIRKGFEEGENFDVDNDTLTDILSPIRSEDEKDDLWTIFNRCQEKIIKGGFSAKSNKGRLRRQRGITSIKKDIDMNQKLWEVSQKYLSAAA